MAEQAETVSGATNSTRPDSSYAGDGNAAPARSGAAELPTLAGRTMADLGAQVKALRNDNAAKDARIAGQRTRAEQAEAEYATALAMMANARDVLAVHRAWEPDAVWIRTLHDNLDGYLRRHQTEAER